MHDAEPLRDSLNRAAIALREAKGIREVNMAGSRWPAFWVIVAPLS